MDLMMFEGLPAPGGEPCPAAPWSMYAAREDVNVTVAGNNAGGHGARSEVSISVSGLFGLWVWLMISICDTQSSNA